MENGIPYAIDFLNPVPDADVHSVGAANFEWIVDQVAELAIARANASPRALALRWPEFSRAAKPANPRVVKARTSTTLVRNTRRPATLHLDATPE